MQEIIDKANIGRSTFYSHFETKDDLLKEMCTDIFTHIFSDELKMEKTHDFSRDNNGLQQKITHILYHLKDSKKDIAGILSCESGELFMEYFKEYLTEMFSKFLNNKITNVPREFLLNHLAGSLSPVLGWKVPEYRNPYLDGCGVCCIFSSSSEYFPILFFLTAASAIIRKNRA